MESGGFGNNQGQNGDERKNGASLVGKGLRKAGEKTGKGLSHAAKKVAGSILKTGSKLSIKRVFVVAVVFLLVVSIVYTFGFFALNENAGETKNYVDYGNVIDSDSKGQTVVSKMSNPNAACLSYYETLSKEKSVYQIKETADGKQELILAGDDDAVVDYFKNDSDYYVDPNLLFCMNRYLFDENNVFPELFLKPVAYDENTFELKGLTDENGHINVVSKERDKYGVETGKDEKSVADYGIASVLKYKKATMTNHMKGSYVKEDYYDEVSGTVKQRSINQPYDIVIETKDYDILDSAVSIAGSVKYNYSETSVKKEAVKSGESKNEADNVEKILVEDKTISRYSATLNENGSSQVGSSPTVYFSSLQEAKSFVSANPSYSIVTDGAGNPVYTAQTFHLYKYRDTTSSGIYSDFVDQTGCDTKDSKSNYLYDYLANFSTYKPIISRTYDSFLSLHSGADSMIYSNVAKYGIQGNSGSSSGSTIGSGSNKFEQLYNGSKKELIETIWDGLLQWGFSEIQAAAVLGNMASESSFSLDVVNSIGCSGLCQWKDGRLTNLKNLAKTIGCEWTDAIPQIIYACMELDTRNTYAYAKCQWMYEQNKTWDSSNDVAEIAKAIALGWERFAIPSQYDRDSSVRAETTNRQKQALSAYELLHGKTFGHQIPTYEVLRPTTPNSNTKNSNTGISITGGAATSNGVMTENDREIFYNFYHALDELEKNDTVYDKYNCYLTSNDIEDLILLTNSYINGTTMAKETVKMAGALWSDSFISNLEDKQESGNTYASTISGIPVGSARTISELDFLFPVDASGSPSFTSRFGPRSSPTAGASTSHKGVDIACASETPIYAAADGVVEIAQYSSSAGNYVQINHGKNSEGETIQTVYMHNSSLLVKAGETVKKGQQIAKAGSTGYSTGTHCHMSLIINGVYHNPLLVYDLNNIPVLDKGKQSTISISASASFTQYLSYGENGFTKNGKN